MTQRLICLVGAAVIAVSVAREAQATTITFDQAISGVLAPDDPGDPFDNCFLYCQYAGTPGNDGGLTTQGFRFTALTNSGTGDHGEAIVVDPTVLPGVPDNGTDWLLAGGIVQMTRADSAPFSLSSFQAANIFPGDPSVGQFVRAFALKEGVFFQLLLFDLSTPGFHTFVLPSTWTGLSAVRFSGRLDANDGSPRITAVDNINATAVPEPASFLLVATGALALLAKPRRR